MSTVANVMPASNFFTGEDKQLRVTIYQTDGRTVQNITGWALSWTLKQSPTGAVVMQKTTADNIALTNPTAGICTITLTAEDLAVLAGETAYYHELKRTDVGGRSVLSEGAFILRQSLHR